MLFDKCITHNQPLRGYCQGITIQYLRRDFLLYLKGADDKYECWNILSQRDRQAYCLYIRPPQYGSRYTNACRGIPEPLILQKGRITTKTITKNKLVALRFRENEYNLIKSKADKANMNFTEFVTRSTLNKQIIVVDGLPEVLKEIKAIGRNLNQLTTLCNMGKIICPELSELKEQYSNAVVMLDEIARRCS